MVILVRVAVGLCGELVHLHSWDRRVVPKESGLIRARDEVHDE